MKSPAFRFGAPVERPFFCDRRSELALLTERMRTGIHTFVLSPRRYGKTSLLVAARRDLARSGVPVGYANLLLSTTEGEVGAQVLSAVVTAALSRGGRARRSLTEILRRLRVTPSVSVDGSGSVQLSFEPALARRSWPELLDDARHLLEETARARGAALVLDEFQAVAAIGPKGMGGAFKALADGTSGASLVFSGSHLSVMEQLTSRRGAPLYGMGERLVLDLIPEDQMVRFLQRRARSAGRSLTGEVGRLLYRRARGVPHYVQYLAQAAVEATPEGAPVTDERVAAGLERVVSSQAIDFAERVETLAASHQRVLRALATWPTSQVYARAFLESVDVTNPNAVTQALRSLGARELIERRGATWVVVDPFLAHWLEHR